MGASQSQPSEQTTLSQSQQIADKTTEARLEEKAVQGRTAALGAAEAKLPHNYDAILRDADSPIDRSSMDKLYDQLYGGVFLNQKREKFWVEKKFNGNSFMLFARDLLITWSEDNRFWHWLEISEQSNVSVDVAELLNVCWLEIHGKFDTKKLSPGILYEAVFVILLKDPADGWDVPVNVRLTLPNGIREEHKENLMIKPRGQWLEIPVAEFKTSTENMGETEISMYEYDGGKWKRGLVIKGVIIRPKKQVQA